MNFDSLEKFNKKTEDFIKNLNTSQNTQETGKTIIFSETEEIEHIPSKGEMTIGEPIIKQVIFVNTKLVNFNRRIAKIATKFSLKSEDAQLALRRLTEQSDSYFYYFEEILSVKEKCFQYSQLEGLGTWIYNDQFAETEQGVTYALYGADRFPYTIGENWRMNVRTFRWLSKCNNPSCPFKVVKN